MVRTFVRTVIYVGLSVGVSSLLEGEVNRAAGRETLLGFMLIVRLFRGLTRKGLCPFIANPRLPRCSPVGALSQCIVCSV